jgi:DNA-directed RNA polymerase subunit omega
MIYPSADKIDKVIDSKYALVILAAKRAKLVKEGARPLIKTDSPNPLTVALEEIAEGTLQYKFDEESLAGREALADKEAVVGARDIEVEGINPLAEPEDPIARAASQLGAGLSDSLSDEDEESEDAAEEAEAEDEEEALGLADEETEASDV